MKPHRIYLLAAFGVFCAMYSFIPPHLAAKSKSRDKTSLDEYASNIFNVEYKLKSVEGKKDDDLSAALDQEKFPEDKTKTYTTGRNLIRVSVGKDPSVGVITERDIVEQCIFLMVESAFCDFGSKKSLKSSAAKQPITEVDLKIEKTKNDKGYQRVVTEGSCKGAVKIGERIWRFESSWISNYDPFVSQMEEFSLRFSAERDTKLKTAFEVDLVQSFLDTDAEMVSCLVEGFVDRCKAPVEVMDPKVAEALDKGCVFLKKRLADHYFKVDTSGNVNKFGNDLEFYKLSLVLYVLLHHGHNADDKIIQQGMEILNAKGKNHLKSNYHNDYGGPCVLMCCNAYNKSLEKIGKKPGGGLQDIDKLAKLALDSFTPPSRPMQCGWDDISRTQFGALGLHAAYELGIFPIDKKDNRELLLNTLNVILANKFTKNKEDEVKVETPYGGTLFAARSSKKNGKKDGGSGIVMKCKPSYWFYGMGKDEKAAAQVHQQWQQIMENIEKAQNVRMPPQHFAMTCNGVGSLAICYELLLQEPDKKPTMDLELRRKVIQALNDGLCGIQNLYDPDLVYSKEKNMFPNYYLIYGLERAGVLCEVKKYGKHDWYEDGSEYLVSEQGKDGNWAVGGFGADDMNTIYAMLFLSKATAPVSAISSGK